MAKRLAILGLALLLLALGVFALRGRSGGAVGLDPGKRPPDFALKDAWGRPVSLTSLTEKSPGLVFFTATWCLPCIEGLRALKRFERETGPAFETLIVFIDPNESEADLRAFRDRYGFPSRWFYARDDGEMARAYRVRYLDTKFLLDQGTIRWKSLAPANEATWREAFAKVGVRR